MPLAKMPAPPVVTHALAERHEALWLRLTALHKDLGGLAAKKPAAPVGEALRITAESLLSDCRPFAAGRGQRLPVAAPDNAGLLVQLGQALALLDGFEARHSFWSAGKSCRCWRVNQGDLPVLRLRPNLPPPATDARGRNLRALLAKQLDQRWNGVYENGFAAGRAARQGPPAPDEPDPAPARTAPRSAPEATPGPACPRLRSLD